MGAAAGMIGDLLSGKKDSIQSDTLNVKGLSIERQAQAEYQGSVNYQGTIGDYSGSQVYENEYQGSVDYQGTVDYRGSQE